MLEAITSAIFGPPTPGEPLGRPPGTVRAVLSLLIVVGFLVSVFAGYTGDQLKEAALLVIGFYFISRTKQPQRSDTA